MTTVIITAAGNQNSVQFSYDAAVVSLIKTTVPAYARSWDAPSRTWYVDTTWATTLAAELRRYGHTVTGPNDTTRHPPGDNWARLLFKRVGSRHQERVYRALSKCLHPDLGGDHQLQLELNAAHQELTKGTP